MDAGFREKFSKAIFRNLSNVILRIMSTKPSKGGIYKAVTIFFLFAVFLSYLWPVWDCDFPWHVKTGEYIYMHKEIPKTDPFTIGSDGSLSEKFILSQYWLAQLLFYLLFAGYGPIAIVILKSLVLTGIIAILWFSMKETPLTVKAAVLYLTALLFAAYGGERPQLFSFLFAVLAFEILEKYRIEGSNRFLFFLPPIMLVWANVHGGFIFGDVVITVVCASETIKYFFLRKHTSFLKDKRLLFLLGIGLFSILISYLNPNWHYAFSFAIGGVGSPGASLIQEYQSPLAETLGASANRSNFIYWSLMGYVLIVLALNLRKHDITHLAMVFFTLALSLNAVRYVPFFVMTGLLVAGRYSTGIGDAVRFRHKTKAVLLLNIAVLVMVMIWTGSKVRSFPGVVPLSKIGVTVYDSKNAARFIEKNIEKAAIFNSHNIGSWLVFRLYPKFKLFIDTRAYSPTNSTENIYISVASRSENDSTSSLDAMGELLPKDYGKIIVGSGKPPAPGKPSVKHQGHVPLWRELLMRHNIDLIIHEATNVFSGEMYALPLWLMKDDEWKLIYLDGRVLIFVRDIPRFQDVIKRFSLDKSKVIDEIGMENSPRLGSTQSGVYSTLAFALLMKGNSYDVARKYIKQALYLDPKNTTASYLEAYLSLKDEKDKRKNKTQ